MMRLVSYTAALATMLEAAQSPAGGAGGVPLELVRKESLAGGLDGRAGERTRAQARSRAAPLPQGSAHPPPRALRPPFAPLRAAGLDPSAAAKVMAHAYCAVLPIAPLPGPSLPLSAFRPGPTHYGPSPEAASPWLQLALYAASRSGARAGGGVRVVVVAPAAESARPHWRAEGGQSPGGGASREVPRQHNHTTPMPVPILHRLTPAGPLSLVLAAGQRLWRLPPQLEHCSHALMWSWDPEPKAGVESQPLLVEGEPGFVLTGATLLPCRLPERPCSPRARRRSGPWFSY
jgi:hypothetical protein